MPMFYLLGEIRKRAGFTLVEMLVALFILGIVITIAAGSFVSAFRFQRLANQQIQTLNQLSFAAEYISRQLRMAKNITTNLECDASGSGSAIPNYVLTRAGQGIKFKNQQSQCHEFYVATDAGGKRRLWEDKGGVTSQLLANDVEVVNFSVQDPNSSWTLGGLQARVLIFLEVKPAAQTASQPTIPAQILISQRNLDKP